MGGADEGERRARVMGGVGFWDPTSWEWWLSRLTGALP
jgi:hypothetical protein